MRATIRLRWVAAATQRIPIMSRAPLLATLLPIAAALTFGAVQLRSSAQTATPAAANQSFVGAWRLTFDTPAGPSHSLLTVMADGTLLFSGRPVSPATGSFPVIFSSAAHGVWQQGAGIGEAAFTWVGLVTDGEGTLLAEVTDSVEATLSPAGGTWSGRYSATVVDPSGNVLYVGGATVEAARITVQPLATPAGTPAS